MRGPGRPTGLPWRGSSLDLKQAHSVGAAAYGHSIIVQERRHPHRRVQHRREIKWALNDSELARHPDDDRLSGVYGTIIFDDLGDTLNGPHQRNVTVFADGALTLRVRDRGATRPAGRLCPTRPQSGPHPRPDHRS